MDEAPQTRGHKKKMRTRAALLEAAIDVISNQPGGFSIGDVAAAAGVSNGTFYNYFEDRDALIDAVVPEVLERFAIDGEVLVADDEPIDRFARLTSLALRWAASFPEEVSVLLRLDAVHRAIVEAPVLDNMRADIAAGHAQGVFVTGPDAPTLDVIAGAVLVAARRLVEEAVPADYVEKTVAQLLRSLGVVASDASTAAADAQVWVDELHARTTTP